MSSYDELFQPVTLPNGVRLSNRLAIAPMTTWSGNLNGTVSDQELAYYKRRAAIAGLFVSACIAVSPTGVAFDHQFIAYDDAVLPRLKKMAEAIKSAGSKAVLQIHHGGSEADPHFVLFNQTVSASEVPSFSNPEIVPQAMTQEQIETVIHEYGLAARQAIRAGFDGIEIHGANHYLIQQFVSAHFNQRSDQWGGTLEKRLRFPFAVLEEVQSVVKKYADDSFIVGYRFSPEEIHRYAGYSVDDTLQLVDGLIERGVHYLHVSQNNIKTVPAGKEEGSDTIVHVVSAHIHGRVPLIAVGGIHYPEEAVAGLHDGADLVALGREAIIDPDWTQKVRDNQVDQIHVTLNPDKQDELVVPDRLWKIITKPSGWFPLS
ncbi:NADH-dependent flavin oxidoreductase [Sporolactobacillus pectinivorans]|uniref:NADH-dependent flavin oxidoreductase n=1 Tax=Sporolactobacillus pectinivorans TaxID=1591408 RepID=UPI000C26951D|nr:NADH-dependent flavin oxidoreductase [Sporolactobacillus pectinivorans]